jgi:Protein of unknown function (DUF3309)
MVGSSAAKDAFGSGKVASKPGPQVATSPVVIFILLIVLLVLATAGTAPYWGHSRGWGYGPSGGTGTLLLIVLCIWFFMGRG